MIFVTVSTGHFDPLIEACDKLKAHYEFFGQIGMGSFVPNFLHVRTVPPTELEKYMREASLVISHAGTGMLSMLYRLKKKVIIVPKQARYGEANNGQVELAQKWDELGMGLLCMDVHDLHKMIKRSETFTPVFPTFPSIGKSLLNEWGSIQSTESRAA